MNKRIKIEGEYIIKDKCILKNEFFLIYYKNYYPFNCFKRIVLYFVGLCLGYYRVTSFYSIYNAITIRNEYLLNIFSDLKDFIYILLFLFLLVFGVI